MKLSVPSPKAALKVLKAIFFHPMLYGAILLHWAVIQQPLPAAKVQEPELEEPLPEAVSIAQSNTLTQLSDKPKPKSKPKAKSSEEKDLKKNVLSKPKSKPKPLAQALAKNNPTPKAEPIPSKKEDSESQSAEKNKSDLKENSEREDEIEKDSELEADQDSNSDNSEDSDNSDNSEDSEGVSKFLQSFADQDFFGGSSAEQSVGFNLQLLPQPELIFTSDSIQAYNSLTGELVALDNVLKVQWWNTVPQRDAVNQFSKKYPGVQAKQVGEYAGGSLYEMSQGDDVFYASFITNPAKKTLAASTAFVIWKSNPLS